MFLQNLNHVSQTQKRIRPTGTAHRRRDSCARGEGITGAHFEASIYLVLTSDSDPWIKIIMNIAFHGEEPLFNKIPA
jgi:hypothetical protein